MRLQAGVSVDSSSASVSAHSLQSQSTPTSHRSRASAASLASIIRSTFIFGGYRRSKNEEKEPVNKEDLVANEIPSVTVDTNVDSGQQIPILAPEQAQDKQTIHDIKGTIPQQSSP